MEASSFTLEQFEPIRDLVDSAFEEFQNISTIRAPSLYLPQLAGQTIAPTVPVTNLPGAILPVAAYKTIRLNAGLIWTGIDYTAEGSMSLRMRWKELSKSATTMPKIIQFLWTDIAASALVGSKGVLGSRNMEPDQAATINIHPTVHRVKYHWPFAIPAFIVALLIGPVFVVVVLSVVFGNASLGGMKQNLKQISVGRILTSVFHPESSDLAMEPVVWSKGNGSRLIDMSGGHPRPDTEDD